MPSWKKLLRSGSFAHLSHITASQGFNTPSITLGAETITSWDGVGSAGFPFEGDAVITGSLYVSGAGITGNVESASLGTATTGLNQESAGTSVYNAINNIDNILSKLAPSKPSQLNNITMAFTSSTAGQHQGGMSSKFSGYGPSNVLTSSITTNPIQFISSSGEFWDAGPTNARVISAFITDSYGTSYVCGQKIISDDIDDTGEHKSTDNPNIFGFTGSLYVKSDKDYWEGVPGREGFWNALTTTISASMSASAHKYKAKLLLQADEIQFDYWVAEPNVYTDCQDVTVTHSLSDGYHWQSGVRYLGKDDVVKTSQKVVIDSDALFLNSSRIIASIDFGSSINNQSYEVNTNYIYRNGDWSPGDSYIATQSLAIKDSRFVRGNRYVRWKKYRAESTSGQLDSYDSKNMAIDSTNEDEKNPTVNTYTTYRSGSGTGQFPNFSAGAPGAATTFGKVFDTELSLKTSNHFELQYSNRYFHWPASINYTNYIPPGPNYTSMNSDSYSSMRWATFRLADITNASNIELHIENCYGFDSSAVQTNDNFEMYLKIMDGDSEVTKWIDCNAVYAGGVPGESVDGIAGISSHDSPSSSGGDFKRTITFAGVSRTGTPYVRIGWNSSGGTSPTGTSTRKFKYIYISDVG